jgi:hypothetical protein
MQIAKFRDARFTKSWILTDFTMEQVEEYIKAIEDERDGLKAELSEAREALLLAATALEIADDWNLPAVQIHPPKDWNLDGGGEDSADGWCATGALADKLREMAEGREGGGR